MLSMSELLQHQRDESTEKHGQRNHGRRNSHEEKNTGITSMFLKNGL